MNGTCLNEHAKRLHRVRCLSVVVLAIGVWSGPVTAPPSMLAESANAAEADAQKVQLMFVQTAEDSRWTPRRTSSAS
jgi:hypothetical protein